MLGAENSRVVQNEAKDTAQAELQSKRERETNWTCMVVVAAGTNIVAVGGVQAVCVECLYFSMYNWFELESWKYKYKEERGGLLAGKADWLCAGKCCNLSAGKSSRSIIQKKMI